jgi:uncharacterized membrane protein
VGAQKHRLNKLLITVFVDGVWIHRFWGCHRLPERSFFVEGRQFHVCARCTGLIVGLPVSILLIPLRDSLPFVFALFGILLIADGLTQFVRWRTSNNQLRFITGFGTAATLLPSAVDLLGRL